MKLLWSPYSPYVRKVLILACGLGVISRIELERVKIGMGIVNDGVMRHNPLSKIPTLILEDGRALFDSLVIGEYLAHAAGRPSLVPAGDARWETFGRHAVASGLSDLSILLFNENLRKEPLRSPALLDALPAKRAAALTWLDGSPPPLDATALDAAATAGSLAFLDLRFANLDWRKDCPNLAEWCRDFEDLPAVGHARAIIAAADK